MKTGYAVILKNFFPSTANCTVRSGHLSYATGMGSNAVDSLMEWAGPAGRQFFAAAGSSIYDVSVAGAVGAAVVSGLSNVRFQHTMFATSGGNFLVACNGADSVRNYDGTTWTTPAITNVTSSTLISVMAHQRRLWFIQKDTLKVWYLASESIAGAATAYDLGPLFKLGGSLLAIGSWSRDGGAGPDDLAVFVTTRGEVAVYSGTDPSDSTNWSLVGIFRIDVPIGRRCLLKIGADLGVITTGGVSSLGQILPLAQGSIPRVSITNNIINAFSQAAQSYGSNFGWQIAEYPRGNWCIVNIPVTENSSQIQYVMNTLTGAWCEYEGMNAACWSLYGEDLYFGGNDGTVYRADIGTTDDGDDILGDMLPAFSYFGERGNQKRFTMARPIFQTNGIPIPALDVKVDFDLSPPTSLPSYQPSTLTPWGTALWGFGLWGSTSTILKQWTSVYGIGYSASIRMQISTNEFALSVNSFDLLFESGGYI